MKPFLDLYSILEFSLCVLELKKKKKAKKQNKQKQTFL